MLLRKPVAKQGGLRRRDTLIPPPHHANARSWCSLRVAPTKKTARPRDIPRNRCDDAHAMASIKSKYGARPHFADQALVNRAASASRPCGIDPSRKNRSCCRPGRKLKPDLYAVVSCTKVRPHSALPRYRTAAKGHFRSFGEVSLWVRVATGRRRFLSR